MEAPEALEKFKEYSETIQNQLAAENTARFIYNINHIRNFSKELADFILKRPIDVIPFIEEDLQELTLIKHIGFVGSFGSNSVNPRTLKSTLISRMISVEGIVTSVSLVRPKIQRSVHYSESSNEFLEKEYRDNTMISKLAPTNTIYPLKDNKGNPITTEFGLSDYFDFQTILVQEMPENSPPGQLPRSLEVILTDDLVDSTKPGDRIKIYGVYKSIVPLAQKFPNQFRTVCIANNIKPLKDQVQVSTYSLEKLKLLSESDLKFKSIAPSIYGHDLIKKAILMQMVGGNEVIMKNGSRIRGDINILLVGDPSTAKSQLLRYTLNFAPLSVATTGRGSSGVGLTAAVVQDKDTGDRRLEAGAMVLADGGIVCIDEFDKMDENDRVAIHEVMEQQTVTISKAGIHTTLNARCSVLAAANPIFGSYDERRTPSDNVKLPESLMTRFDLVFITIDKATEEIDNLISNHVIKMHMDEKAVCGEVSQNLLKEFVAYAKKLRPSLSREAASLICKEYTNLRANKNSRHLVVSITPRLLETIIRLSTAHAKLRLSEVVEEVDVIEVIEMVNLSILKKPIRKQQVRKPQVVEEEKLGDEIVISNSKDEIKEAIWSWRSENVNEHELSISEIVSKGFNKSEVEEVAFELAAQDVVLYEDKDEKIYFLD